MEVKMKRTKGHIYERIAMLVSGVDSVRRSRKTDEVSPEEIQVCIADRLREMQWRS
jgi:hypothetical protein